MRPRLSFLLAAIAGFLVPIALLYFSIASFAFNEGNYPLSSPLFREMAAELAGYLSGKLSGLSNAFTQREQDHMVDVLALFQAGKGMAVWCVGLSVPLGGLAFFFGGRKRLGQGLLLGTAFLATCVLGLGIYAMVDFNGWFTAMHKIVFTNDLWLLDPRDSQLIQMLPIDFFIHAAKRISMNFSLLFISFVASALWLSRLKIRKRCP